MTGTHTPVQRLWARRVRRLAGISFFFALAWAPFVDGNEFFLGWALCSAIVGLSMNVLAGYAGQISLAQAALFGGGAFLIGNLVAGHTIMNGEVVEATKGVPWVVFLPVAGLLTAALAMVIGFPALRVRGLNLAILTLGFQFVMERSIFRSSLLTGGASGVEIEPPRLFGVELTGRPMLLAIMAALVTIWMIDRNLTLSRGGRALFALRQDEQVAASFGISVARYKLMAFAISGFYAGIAGALFATLIGEVTQNQFEFQYSIEFLVFAVLGGLGSRGGTAVGAAFPVVFREVLRDLGFRGVLLGGALLVATLIQYPGGQAELGRELAHAAELFWRRGKAWCAAFFGLAIAAVAVGIAVGALLWNVSSFWAIVVGLVAVSLIFRFGSRALGRKAFGSAAGSTTATTAIEAIKHAEALQEVRSTPRPPVSPALFRRAAPVAAHKGPLLEVADVAIRFGGVRALDGVSMEVRSGELIGIMGPNGSGKTTMLNCISGFLKPNSGDIRFRGRSILGLAPHERAALGLGRTFQNIGLVKQETVFDNFVIAQHMVCGYGPMEGLLRTGAVLSEERRLRQRALAAIDLLELTDVMFERVRSLPHGKAKLVELGCALVTGPELLLLDEPAAGVSPQEADALGEALKRISAEFGVTILMIEHHVPLMLSTCDYIYVLNFGQMLTHGEPMEVARHPDVITAYLGGVGREATLATAGSH